MLDKMRFGTSEAERGWQCPNVELLSAYIDQNATAREREHIEQHLAGCDFCRDQVGFIARLQAREHAERVPAEWLVRARGLVAGESRSARVRMWGWCTAAATAACAVLAVSLWMRPQPAISPVTAPVVTTTSPQIVAQNNPAAVSKAPTIQNGPMVRNQTSVESVPQIVFPKANTIVAPEGIEFRWKEMKGALSYETRLLSADGDMLWEQRVEELSVKLPPNVSLRTGETYFVWVRAYLAEGKVAQSKATRFTVADHN